MSTPNFIDAKKKYRENLIAQHKSAYEQLGSNLNAGDKIPLKTKISQLEKEIQELDDELEDLCSSSQNSKQDGPFSKIESEKQQEYLYKVYREIGQVNKKCSSSLKNLSNKIDKTELEETHQKLIEVEKIAYEFTRRLGAAELLEINQEEYTADAVKGAIKKLRTKEGK